MQKTIINIKINKMSWLLRLAVFLTFFGHGMVAIKGNIHWIGYLKFIGFSFSTSKYLLTYIGVLDIIVALVTLLKPNKYVLLWAVIWSFSAAIIRPLSGDTIWAFVERGANWITPLILYIYLISQKHDSFI